LLSVAGLRLAQGAEAFSHTFAPGRISVVLGRNHSGKTRLCRLLAGLEPMAEGELRLDGEEIGQLSPGARPVALVYQSFVNYPNLTVADNIASPLRAKGASRDRIRTRVRALAGQLGIAELLERYPEQLSGGQQQRVAIARALAKEARVLVLDEPLVNLDFKLREVFEAELRDMLQDRDLVVVYTTSDPRDAFNLGDEVLLLNDHALVQAGAPLAVYQSPLSSVAADLMSDPGINCWYRDDVLRGVRPEHLDLHSRGAADVVFSAELLSVETNGSETYLHCRFEGAHWVARVDGLIAGQRLPQAGARVELFATADAVLTFPGEQRLG
jgi:glycerol transport system ATP-binding protein